MKRNLKFLAAAGIATIALLSVPRSANAQVAFGGTFRGPHGAFSIGVGPFAPQVGAYLPMPYADEVYLDPDYGYGFYYDSQWFPCVRFGSRWIIAERPAVYRRPGIYGRNYAYGPGYVRPYRNYGRSYVSRDFGRREFNGRRDSNGRQNFTGRQNFNGRQDRNGRRDGNRRSDRGNHRGSDRH